MFHLESSIGRWREQMLAAGITSPVPLDELEIHLREEIERQVKSGRSEEQAFANAMQQIGTGGMIKTEFQKVEKVRSLGEWKFLQIIFFAGIGLISGFIGTSIVFKLGTFSQTSPAQQASGLLAVAVMLLSAFGGYFGNGQLPTMLNERMREGVCLFSAGLMSLWWAIFFFVIIQRSEFTIDRLVLAILWGFVAPFGVLAGFVIGLERAAWKKSTADSTAIER